jgi:two-component system, LytTR family, sensor kinase
MRYSRRKIALLLFVGWTLVALYFAVQAYFNPAATPRIPWSYALLVNFTYYYLWGLCTPLVVWLARRYPFHAGRWARALVVHVVASAVLTAAQILAAEAVLSSTGLRDTTGTLSKLTFAFAVNFQSSLPTYWLILFAWYAIDYYSRAVQLEGRFSQAQLQALRMQLNPHFLFNTLNSVSALMYTDVEAADAMLARLSELLRLTVDRELKQEIPLEQELELVRRYLEIEKIRFEERLRVTIDVPPEAMRAMVPSLALQPLIENAIHHGIAPRREGGAIEIRAGRDNGQLHLSVADDGIGARQQPRERVGLANTRARLEQLYGAAQRLTLTDVAPRGFRVDIVIPFRTEARA